MSEARRFLRQYLAEPRLRERLAAAVEAEGDEALAGVRQVLAEEGLELSGEDWVAAARSLRAMSGSRGPSWQPALSSRFPDAPRQSRLEGLEGSFFLPSLSAWMPEED